MKAVQEEIDFHNGGEAERERMHLEVGGKEMILVK